VYAQTPVRRQADYSDWVVTLLDSMGGGGFGPVVTSTLVARGHDVRKTIGSVNPAEFFVTVAMVGRLVIATARERKYFGAM